MEELYNEAPDTISFVDSEQSKLMIEFTILDVEKENINLMIGEKGCYLSAPSDNAVYVATVSFPCPVNPTEATATYRDGYLTVEIPLSEDIRNFVKVAIV